MADEEKQSNFTTAIQFWKDVNLTDLQKELDKQGLNIVENQKDGLVSRKKLAEHTREFKKIPDEEKLQKFKPLLKGYQTEIDNITRRTKFAENAFLALYKLLADAPDPAPLFEAAVDQSAKLVDSQATQKENETLRSQLEEAEKRLAQLQHVEETNKDLQQKITQMEEKMKDKKTEDVQQKEQEMKQQFNDKITSYKEREHHLQRQLNQALDQLTQLRHTHDDTQAQLINHNQKYDEEVVGKLAELDIVMMDLERANAKIMGLERKNDDLKREITNLQASEEKDNTQATSSNTEAQDAEIAKLIKDVDNYKQLLQNTESRLSKRVKDLSTEVQSLKEERDGLKRSLKEYDDYHEIKRELDIMKYVEFSTGMEDDDDHFDAKGVLEKDDKLRECLEVQLMEKNKRLQSEYTQLKVAFSDLQSESEAKDQAITSLQSKSNEQETLIQRLEEDLLRFGQKNNGNSIVDALSRTSSALNLTAAGHDPLNAKSPETASPRASHDAGLTPVKDDKSILPIVMNQRDRFRQRNAELEEQTRSLEMRLQDMQTEVETVKADNLKLYERLKFVHVWKEEQSKGLVNRSTAVTIDNGESASSPYREFKKPKSPKNDDPTAKYDKLYEESMNPFMQFHRKVNICSRGNFAS
ncbi:CASP C terminal-domain-containing protein [Radiomyces spectabilis]|uniref:CASP C terminal-domain-containing protein n=1 Tax=Radiomyces spectabilis TaxID=64574 RepID=UPI00221EA944|nr:CASP C terminal-domain-containing protein [Radiomyces spectabilis]KAI8391252.1 CASP C terminal-domain-containing protein [Radiomyces spectabilis]